MIYDPDQNKFIIVFLSGYVDSATAIIVAFSQTDDPNGLWNLYELPGNPLNDSLWTDFPMLALTNHELFITVNHLVNNESWQLGWRRTVIWQVNKEDGYNGDSLQTQLHYDINYNNRGIRNLCPVKGGSHLYGSDIYFLSQRNLDVENDTFFLVHLTDTINAASQQLTVLPLISNIPYFVPVNAKQPNSADELATNDSRVLGAFYENDRIQFAGNTTDTSTGTSAIYHGVIADVTSAPNLQLHIISDDTVCYAYPNLSYAGNNSNDNTAIIDVLRSSVDLYPGYSAMVTDGNGNYSVVKNVKDGLNYHQALSGDERWGDYTGSQRNYTAPGRVWVNGSFILSNKKPSTWITELSLTPPPASVPEANTQENNISVFPNPSEENVTIKFRAEEFMMCGFNLYDVNGRMVKLLMHEVVKPGENKFSFSTAPLAAGQYFLVIKSGEKIIATQKVVKQ